MKQQLRQVKSKRLLLDAGIVAAAIILIAAGGTWAYLHARSHTPSRATYTITTGLIGEYAAPIRIAQHQGYFAQHGLHVTIKEYSSGPAAVADVLNGTIDTAVASDFAGVSNMFAGQDIKIVANMSKSDAFSIVARKDHDVHNIDDLRQKRIGITEYTVGQFYLGQFLALHNLRPQDITLVNMTQPELVSAVANGSVDAGVLFEPNAYAAKMALGSNAVSWSVQNGQSIYSLLYGSGNLARKHPEILVSYMQAVLEGEQFIQSHNEQTMQIITHDLHYSPAYMTYIWPRFQFATSLDQELLIDMENEANWAIDNGIAPQGAQLPNYLRFIDLSPLLTIKPDAVTIIH